MGPKPEQPKGTEMNRTALATYLAAEFEKLVRAEERALRPLRPAERAELVQWLRGEFRRLAKHNGEKHSCVYVDRTRRTVRVPVPAQPHIDHGMSLPACLRNATTEANLARIGLPRTAWVRLPQNEALVNAMGMALVG